MEIICYGWACTDCLFLLANGDTPEGMSEEETAAYLARVEDQGTSEDGKEILVDLGGEHDEDCPNMRDGEWIGDTDCDCERVEFTWSRCDICGSGLGGARHAVHFFTV